VKRWKKALIAVAAVTVAMQAARTIGSAHAQRGIEAYRARARGEMAELSEIGRSRPPIDVPSEQTCAAA